MKRQWCPTDLNAILVVVLQWWRNKAKNNHNLENIFVLLAWISYNGMCHNRSVQNLIELFQQFAQLLIQHGQVHLAVWQEQSKLWKSFKKHLRSEDGFDELTAEGGGCGCGLLPAACTCQLYPATCQLENSDCREEKTLRVMKGRPNDTTFWMHESVNYSSLKSGEVWL